MSFWETFVSDALPVSYGASEIIGSNLYLFNGKNFPIVNDKVLNDTVEVINLNDRSIRRDHNKSISCCSEWECSIGIILILFFWRLIHLFR